MKYSFAKTLQTFLIMSRQEKSLKSDQIHICLNIFIFFLSIYLITLSGNVVSDVGVARIDVLSSLVENFDLNIFPHQGTDGVTGADGRLYSWFGIGSVLLSLPLYLLARLFAGDPFSVVSTMNPIIGAGTNVLVFLFSRAIGYQKRTSLIVALIYGLSTIAFYYAKDTGDHAIETFFLLLSFYFMYLHTIEGKISNILFSAFSLGFCFLTRPNSLIAIPALLVLLFFERITTSSKNTDVSLPVRETSFFFIGLTPFIVMYMGYNYYRFGSVLETGYTLIASRLGVDFFGGTSLLTGLYCFLLSPGKGFFYYSPPAILILLSLYPFFKQTPRIATSFVVLVCTYFLFFSKNLFWHGDWAWGPRYLVTTLPFFIIPTALLLEQQTRRIKYFILLIVATGVCVQIMAITVHPSKHFFDLLDKNIPFNVTQGVGVPPIIEPPKDTYYEWRKSPIFTQFKSLTVVLSNTFEKRNAQTGLKASHNEFIRFQLRNTLDLWWIYSWVYQKSYNGFIAVIALLLIALNSCRHLYNLVFRSNGYSF